MARCMGKVLRVDKRWALPAALVWLVLLAGCADRGQWAQRGPGESPKALSWNCVAEAPAATEAPVTLVTEFQDDGGLWLFAPDFSGRLEPVPTGSGSRFDGSGRQFWAKGREARYGQGGKVWLCREDRAASWFEDAKLRGADIRAVGNEPGWALEIGSEKLFLVSDYGLTRLEFDAQPPEINEEGRVAVWRASSGGRTLEVRLEGQPCADSMSGEQYESTVLVVLDGKRLMGCGKALH